MTIVDGPGGAAPMARSRPSPTDRSEPGRTARERGGTSGHRAPGSPDAGGVDPTDLATSFVAVRELTEALAAPLSAEDQTVQSMPDVSPTKWHRAHTTWFFETFVLERFEAGFRPYEPAYRMLFNSYYDAVGEQFPRARRGVITRPGAAEVGRYRTDVDRRLLALLSDGGPAVPTGPAPDHDGLGRDRLIELGLHHEQQHQELLLMDAKHVLAQNPLEPRYRARADEGPTTSGSSGPPAATRPVEWIGIEGGLVEIGHDGDGFSFDNEQPRHRVHLEPFALADRLVTTEEWLGFIDDGGYERPELWLSDGWHTVQREGWEAPLYWRRGDDGWRVHTLGGTRPVQLAEPVCHVSSYEADAFARWAGARLPTEFEWEHAVATAPTHADPFSLDRLHPTAAPPADGRLLQVTGDVWQWTASAYLPFPGFVAAEGAVGEYNGKFMSGQMVLRGGAAITPPDHSRPTYRNFFPPSARWPMTGVRLAR